MSPNDSIDIEILIACVQENPELWGESNEGYKDKVKRQESGWPYMCPTQKWIWGTSSQQNSVRRIRLSAVRFPPAAARFPPPAARFPLAAAHFPPAGAR